MLISRCRNLVLASSHIPKLVDSDHNEAIMRETSFSEVEGSVTYMPRNKALGLNGFTMDVFKAWWSFIGREVIEVVEESHRK